MSDNNNDNKNDDRLYNPEHKTVIVRFGLTEISCGSFLALEDQWDTIIKPTIDRWVDWYRKKNKLSPYNVDKQ